MTEQSINAVVAFDPKAVATYGNKMLHVLVQHEDAKSEAEKQLQQAGEREKVIDVELARVALHLHKEEKIDLFAIYAGNKDASSKLYRSILVETGAMSRTLDETTDRAVYDFTDEALKGKFYFDEELKKSDEAEYTKRRSRRNSLNIRLQRVCKAALALFEAGANVENIQVEKSDDGELSAVITKGPKEVMGSSANAQGEGRIQLHAKSVPAVEGATVTPTITGLAKVADSQHKAKPASKDEIETAKSAKGEKASGEDFLAIVNAAIMAIRNKEGKVSASERTILKTLLTETEKCVK